MRQSMVKAVLEDEDEAEPLRFVGSRDMSDGRSSILTALRSLINVPIESFHSQQMPMTRLACCGQRSKIAAFSSCSREIWAVTTLL